MANTKIVIWWSAESKEEAEVWAEEVALNGDYALCIEVPLQAQIDFMVVTTVKRAMMHYEEASTVAEYFPDYEGDIINDLTFIQGQV